MSIIQSIANDFMMNEDDLRVFLRTAPYRYKRYTIPKRNGKGIRHIAQPASAVKKLQIHTINNYLKKSLPVHGKATAYKKGSGIKRNASFHCSNAYLLKMDFKDFFPSIHTNDVIQHGRKHISEFTNDHIFLFKRLFFMKIRGSSNYNMTIGAVSYTHLTLPTILLV